MSSTFVSSSFSASSLFLRLSKFLSFFNLLRHLHLSGCLLKSSIFVVQKTTAPKNGVEFCQGFISAIRSSLAMLYDVWWRRRFFWTSCIHIQTHKATYWCHFASPKLSNIRSSQLFSILQYFHLKVLRMNSTLYY